MDLAQQVNILCLVKDHFSKATESDGMIVWEDVKGYGFDDAKRAIEDHRREKGSMAYRPDPRRIRSLAATYHNDRRRTRVGMTTIAWLRLNDRDGSLLELPDERAILTHYRRCWEAVQESGADEVGVNGIRAFILGGARYALTEIGTDDVKAEVGARWCVGLEPGEKIPRKPLFKALPPPLEAVKSFDALVSLAKAPEPAAVPA